jgi:hypothetical protein
VGGTLGDRLRDRLRDDTCIIMIEGAQQMLRFSWFKLSLPWKGLEWRQAGNSKLPSPYCKEEGSRPWQMLMGVQLVWKHKTGLEGGLQLSRWLKIKVSPAVSSGRERIR